MPVRTMRYDGADYIHTDGHAIAYAGAVLDEEPPMSPEDSLLLIVRGMGMAALAKLAGVDHDAVCMAFKTGDRREGEMSAEDVLRALSKVPMPAAEPVAEPVS